MKRAFDYLFPVALGVALLALWQLHRHGRTDSALCAARARRHRHGLCRQFSLLDDLAVFHAQRDGGRFLAALVAGVSVAILFSQSRLMERALYPYAVILQVTPVVAIAPLILIWVGFEHINTALVLIAGLVAFFPILSNTTLGLKSADFNLMELMRLYGASRWQILWRLQLPTALPYLLGALKIAGGLALIGAVVAEFVAGSGTATGLAWRIVEAGNRLEIATMFAALGLLAALGVAIFAALSGLEYLLLRRWHESALKPPS